MTLESKEKLGQFQARAECRYNIDESNWGEGDCQHSLLCRKIFWWMLGTTSIAYYDRTLSNTGCSLELFIKDLQFSAEVLSQF